MFGLAPAPELSRSGQVWFNVEYPLSLADLRGRLVILDFWTACCVNCLHILPVLQTLEETFGESLVVIGVHSPKYLAERDPKCLANAICRLGIRHPVIHDPDFCLWRAYGICAWPTLVFIGPDGKVVGELQGEPITERLLAGVGRMIRQWRQEGVPRPTPLPSLVAPTRDGRLAFPTKIKRLRRPGKANHWVVADSGHHQIVVFDDDGREWQRYGSGLPGFIDADASHSAFRNPQGLICDDQGIYVADTGNHAIRHIDLASGAVSTIAGTGERGCILKQTLPARQAELASVWDLELNGDRLFFANAGTHQLGELSLSRGELRPLAGTGGEALEDGDATAAQLAQPAGLALDPTGRALYFADSESSSVRRLWLADRPQVETLVGAGLFDFGYCNGGFTTARLQHCRGLAWWNGSLLVADTYNSMLRRIDLEQRCVTTVAGCGRNGTGDGELTGGEPAGVCVAGADRILVADTNHHRIVELHPSRGTTHLWPA